MEDAGEAVCFAANVNTDPLRSDKVAQIHSVWAKVMHFSFSFERWRNTRVGAFFVLYSFHFRMVFRWSDQEKRTTGNLAGNVGGGGSTNLSTRHSQVSSI